MSRLGYAAMALALVGCGGADAVNPPLGSQLTLSPQAMVAPPGTVFPMDILVYDGTSGRPLNDVYVDINALGATLIPAEAIYGYGSTSTDSEPTQVNGECQTTGATTWCDGYLQQSPACDETSASYDPTVCANESCLPTEEYYDCLDDYYFQPSSLGLEISPTYARMVTDDRGVARVFVLMFCTGAGGGLSCSAICAGDKAVKLEGTILVTIGVTSQNFEISYQAGSGVCG